MEHKTQARLVLTRLLAERRNLLPRAVVRFLDGLLSDEAALDAMAFCRMDERLQVRNSVLIATEGPVTWSVLLDHEPGSKAATRPRQAGDGSDLSPEGLLERLRALPVWFLAVDAAFALPEPGAAARTERTLYGLAALQGRRMRRLALIDQIDAALEDGDRDAYDRLRELLEQV